MDKEQQPKVSIVMPCYNKVEHISRMLDSILVQKWDNIELILVNDGSTDGTREIIAQYEPKFLARGYEVVIIDQENLGTADAVKNGLSRITGEYVCCVDSDDRLHPEYVPKMAGILCENPICEMAVCGYKRIYQKNVDNIVDNAHLTIETDINTNFLLNILLHRSISQVWRFMVRTRYLRLCRVTESFVTRDDVVNAESLKKRLSPKALKTAYITQEPSFLIPLAAGGGQVAQVKDALYEHNMLGYKRGRRSGDKDLLYIRDYIKRRSVDLLSLPSQEKERLHIILDYMSIKQRYNYIFAFENEEDIIKGIAKEAAAYINRYFTPNPEISYELIMKTGKQVLFHVVESVILGHKISKPHIGRARRIIGIGACGSYAKTLLPILGETEMSCDLLWDNAAVAGDNFSGHIITKPDTGSLQAGDVVMSLSIRADLHTYVKRCIENIDGVICLSCFEVLDFLVLHYYGKMLACCFAPQNGK